jgi:hypothetical protein
VDADRVALTGHGAGGTAVWDLGMAHPDQFSALAPFNAIPKLYCEKYVPNISRLPVFVVMGGLLTAAMQPEFAKYAAKSYDAVCVSYPARGSEGFGSETPTVFEWLSRKRRDPVPHELSVATARQSDRRFYWLRAETLRPGVAVAPQLYKRQIVRPATMSGTVNDANGILIRTNSLEEIAILLSPGLVQFDAPGLLIKVNNKQVHRGPIEPDFEGMLRELRRTGDAKRLLWKTILVRL